MYSHIGIDWGEKICGISFGNQDLDLIIPSEKSHSTDTIIYFLESYLTQYPSIKTFVVGYPSNFGGSQTQTTHYIIEFVAQLQDRFRNIEVDQLDERNTTKQALKLLPNRHFKYQRDNLSAYTLLQHYFNKLNHTS
jgi:RNase H-fold protein (predicted Holliday junction resolvase)